jgi:hypothetical protein
MNEEGEWEYTLLKAIVSNSDMYEGVERNKIIYISFHHFVDSSKDLDSITLGSV